MLNFYGATALTGGGTGALDKLDGDDLSDKDGALVILATGIHLYILDDDSGAGENSPDIIAPDTNPGTKRWIRVDMNYFAGDIEMASIVPGTSLVISRTGGDVNLKVISTTDNANLIVETENNEYASFMWTGTGSAGQWSFTRVANTLDLRFYSWAGGIGEVMRLQYSTGFVGINTDDPKSFLHVAGLSIYADNAAAIVGGLTAGAFYRTGADPDPVCVVH